MTGSMIIIDLPGPVAAERVTELGAALEALADGCREARLGSYDAEIRPTRLGVEPAGDDDAARTFTVNIAGPGFGDEGVFRAEHAEDPDLKPLIGFVPTHDVVVAGPGDDLLNRRMLIELAATVQDLVGGVADLRASARMVEAMRGLPGMVAAGEGAGEGVAEADGGRSRVFGTPEFLRAWAAAPAFEDYLLWAWRHRGHY